MLSEEFKICKDTAEQFMDIAKKLGEDINTTVNNLSAFSVNAAFACELFFKSILIYNSTENKAAKGHDLNTLFEELPQSIKTKMTNEYQSELNKNLKAFLQEYGNSFIEWRYPYEQPLSMEITEILTLTNILYNYVNTLS